MKLIHRDWKTTSLQVVADIVMGQSPSSEFYSTDEIGLPFLQGCGEFGRRHPEHKLYCSQIRKLANKGAILFSVRAPVGKLNIADKDYIIGRGLGSISGTLVSTHYLEHFLQFKAMRLNVISQGSTFEAINSTQLARWPVAHPINKHEQTKIAETLSIVDKAIEQTELLIAKQQRIKSGLMQELLTRGIDENGKLRSEITHEFKDSPLGRIPVEWKVSPLSEFADIRVSNVDKKIYKAETTIKLCNYMDVYTNDYVTASIDFLSATASKSEIYRFGLQAGDVIITKDSETPDDIGVSSVVTETIDKLVCGYHLALIRLRNSDVDSIYLAKQISSTLISRYYALNANGSTRFGLLLGTIEDTWIPIAPYPEQIKIAKTLFQVDETIEKTESIAVKLNRIKTGLMQDLLTGKVRVTRLLTRTEVENEE